MKTSHDVVKRLDEISAELMQLANLNSGPETNAILKADAALREFLEKPDTPTPWLSGPALDAWLDKER